MPTLAECTQHRCLTPESIPSPQQTLIPTKAKLLVAALLLLCQFSGIAQQTSKTFRVNLDLTSTVDDRLSVEVIVPKIKAEQAIFHMPKIVPGVYGIHNYGAVVTGLVAFDAEGESLPVTRRDHNSWMISNARQLHKLVYNVDDTFDSAELSATVFEPSGTAFEHDSIFLINTFGCFGYIKGMENHNFDVTVSKPDFLFGSTALKRQRNSTETTDRFRVKGYHRLADNPIMYSRPDTTWIEVDRTRVLISVFSETGEPYAEWIAEHIRPILEAHKDYLGGKLPVRRYTLLFYLTDKKNLQRYGALEHSMSSVYYLPTELSRAELSTTIRDMVAHEFLHIVTPLTIHSKEIANFDFIEPKMSKHLWLYEGMTEYGSHHSQLKAGLIDFDTYIERQLNMIEIATGFFNDTMSFTEMSANVLGYTHDQYQNVYYKGPLIGLCLDVTLRELSNGAYGTQDLMRDLGRRYGPNRAFDDSLLFSDIAQLTYPAVYDFLLRHVEGEEPLPLMEVFEKIGVVYDPQHAKQEPESSFQFGAGVDEESGELFIVDTSQLSALGTRLGFQVGDRLVSFNDEPFTLSSFAELFSTYVDQVQVGDPVKWQVRRQIDGVDQLMTLTAVIEPQWVTKPHLQVNPNPSEEQQRLRELWMGRMYTPAVTP